MSAILGVAEHVVRCATGEPNFNLAMTGKPTVHADACVRANGHCKGMDPTREAGHVEVAYLIVDNKVKVVKKVTGANSVVVLVTGTTAGSFFLDGRPNGRALAEAAREGRCWAEVPVGTIFVPIPEPISLKHVAHDGACRLYYGSKLVADATVTLVNALLESKGCEKVDQEYLRFYVGEYLSIVGAAASIGRAEQIVGSGDAPGTLLDRVLSASAVAKLGDGQDIDLAVLEA